jgi:ribonuclease P protein component
MAGTSSKGGDFEAAHESPINGGISKARFDQIYQEGKRVSGELCRLMALPGTGKIGFATPRAVGNVPRRNKLKRRFKAAVLEMERQGCCDLGNLDMIFAISAKADRAPFQNIQQDLESAVRRMTERWVGKSESS